MSAGLIIIIDFKASTHFRKCVFLIKWKCCSLREIFVDTHSGIHLCSKTFIECLMCATYHSVSGIRGENGRYTLHLLASGSYVFSETLAAWPRPLVHPSHIFLHHCQVGLWSLTLLELYITYFALISCHPFPEYLFKFPTFVLCSFSFPNNFSSLWTISWPLSFCFYSFGVLPPGTSCSLAKVSISLSFHNYKIGIINLLIENLN